MEEQVLKDLIATSESLGYNWDEIMPKFPELEGIELQVLKDYVETAKAYDYDYDVINPKFPELNIKKAELAEEIDRIKNVLEDADTLPRVEPDAPAHFPRFWLLDIVRKHRDVLRKILKDNE